MGAMAEAKDDRHCFERISAYNKSHHCQWKTPNQNKQELQKRMALNDSGKSPWERKEQPNLDEFLNHLQNQFRKNLKPSNLWIIFAILAIAWLATGIYRVEPGEQGVIRRFGKLSETVGPGIHFHMPWPVEKRDVVRVDQIRKMELGFRSIQNRSGSAVRAIASESLMITGDENLVNVMVVVQYRISDLPMFLFQVWDPEGTPDGLTLRDAAETALRGVVGSMEIDGILTTGRAVVQDNTKIHLQALLDSYRTGIQITEVKLQAVDPPEPVDAAFKDVVSAKEDRERIINEAQAYREDLLPKARGQAEKMVRDAEGYMESKVRGAKGESERFRAMLTEYNQAKEITRRRLYLETMQEVLSKIEKTIISADVGSKSLPLLPLGGQGMDGGNRKPKGAQ